MSDTSDTKIQLPCPHCGATNRLPAERIDDGPSCGKCGQALIDGQPIDLNDGNFDAVIDETRLPVLVDFWAAWCGPCQMMAPAFKQAAAQLKGRALLVKVNSDESPELSRRYGIRSIPTLVKFVNGREVARQSGAVPLGTIVGMAAR